MPRAVCLTVDTSQRRYQWQRQHCGIVTTSVSEVVFEVDSEPEEQEEWPVDAATDSHMPRAVCLTVDTSQRRYQWQRQQATPLAPRARSDVSSLL
jgi:hypothetical protein